MTERNGSKNMTSLRNKWTPTQIQTARRTELKPLLEELGYRLDPLKNDNWKVYGLSKEIIIKEHYWSSPQNGTGGNAIDLLTQVMGMSFSEAMSLLRRFGCPTTS